MRGIVPAPQIQIQQTYAQLGIDADLGTQHIEQPRPTFEMEQPRAKLEIQSPNGRLEIDQSKAWDALGLGGHLNVMNNIYSMAPQIALQGLARIVDEGNRMADLTNPGNPFAEFAMDWRRTFDEFDFRGPAAYNNVSVNYVPGNLSIEASASPVQLRTAVNAPILSYDRGKLDIYMQQYGSVQITPPPLVSLQG
ncbi:DUF6470 family protein [Cohnella sp. 56]|uniref:DUF6470 family protein n=1 Tax=Cohnella sp. 56 TaxID=3113722 RepID=UPI0030EABC5D